DFVPGKGQGLIFNLHGPPGVGKTLTAEATSEVTGSPLYIMGVGDLGAELEALEKNLRKVFALAYRWKAVVLIDEADVFLEKRGLHGIERNAMVAVLLRQIEYYPGILFLTTNRIKVFDEAMMSRIHLSFYYPQLDVDARARLWKAFLSRTNLRILEEQSLVWLSKLPLNGREIKNIVKLSSAVA
ncbi:P-loop containing nucleoside triphosphate hydrolase protein, partial [Gloeophyllum trabeum ATCC 11539]